MEVLQAGNVIRVRVAYIGPLYLPRVPKASTFTRIWVIGVALMEVVVVLGSMPSSHVKTGGSQQVGDEPPKNSQATLPSVGRSASFGTPSDILDAFSSDVLGSLDCKA